MMRDAEFQLIVAACAVSVDERQLETPPRTIRWDRFLALAGRHRVQALCWDALKPLEDMPRAIAAELQAQGREIIVANLRAAAESRRLLREFEDAGIKLLFLKGLTLGALAYRNSLSKMSVDIDLLVDPGQRLGACRLLRLAGYAVTQPAAASDADLARWHNVHKESVWHRASDNLNIDLHTRLADQPAMLTELGVGSPSRAVEVASGISLPTLAEDELFAYLCVHGASSAWFRLKWVTDLAGLLAGKEPGEIERLHVRSQELGAGRAAAQALLLAERIYAIGIGPGLRDRLAADPATRWLLRMAEAQLLNSLEPTERPLGTATIHLSQLGLLPGWRFKLSEAVRQVSSALGMGAP